MPLVADYGVSSDESDDNVPTQPVKSSQSDPLVHQSAEQPNDVLEDFVKKTNYGNKPLEKPPPKPTIQNTLSKMRLPAARGKVQISIPTIEDSDSDDDQPKQKKLKPSSGASGFLGSLPAPRASAGGKESGRTFIPYSLTKQQKTVVNTTSKKPATSVKSPSLTKSYKKAKLTEEYSDSDDEIKQSVDNSSSGNFFSLLDDSNVSKVNSMPSVNPTPSLVSNMSVIATNQVQENSSQPRITAASLYNMTDTAEESYTNTAHSMDSEPSEVNQLLQDEQFLRLQGKKQRGKETIEIIDVHTDDQKASELELTKNLSQEVDPAAFAHRKKGEGPTGQQKRKHQITYLAFQAKERELELKNTWAANRATKQQTQAKYGF